MRTSEDDETVLSNSLKALTTMTTEEQQLLYRSSMWYNKDHHGKRAVSPSENRPEADNGLVIGTQRLHIEDGFENTSKESHQETYRSSLYDRRQRSCTRRTRSRR